MIKRTNLVLFFVMMFCWISFIGRSAPGDTTTVTIFQNLDVNHYGNFDTTVALPDATNEYQKIRLVYTLGRKSCPPGTQYCGSWDYTTGVYAKESGTLLDSLELMRVVTPYATDWPITRTFSYVAEVTDYSSILHDSVDFNYYYEGYSWGFTLTLQLQMIEGEAPRKAVNIKNIYDDYFAYGDAANPIENHLISKTESYAAPATTARIKNIISGHGSDNTGCSEFCRKWYKQLVDGNVLEQHYLWKADCGLNELYPQTGTWLFDRANWCPGEQVDPIYHDLSNVTSAGVDFDVNMDLQPYTSSNPSAGYNIVSQLITYEAPTYQLDAAVTDIIAPSGNENYNRFNPRCSHPIIKIRNEGATPLTSAKIAYWVKGGQKSYYTWEGNLAFMEEAVVDLGTGIQALNSSSSNVFKVEIVEMNGATSDETTWNNTYRSTFKTVPQLPGDIWIRFRTNGSTNSQNSGYSETSWKILDADGNVVTSKINNTANTLYNDTVHLAEGCYTFVMDDAGCDGFSWWYYQYYNPNPGNGTLVFLNANDNQLIDNFSGDFGCQFKYSFTVGYTMGVEDFGKNELNFNLFPNPASDQIKLTFPNQPLQIKYTVIDAKGSVVLSGENVNLENGQLSIQTKQLDEGFYSIRCTDLQKQGYSTAKKFVIQR